MWLAPTAEARRALLAAGFALPTRYAPPALRGRNLAQRASPSYGAQGSNAQRSLYPAILREPQAADRTAPAMATGFAMRPAARGCRRQGRHAIRTVRRLPRRLRASADRQATPRGVERLTSGGRGPLSPTVRTRLTVAGIFNCKFSTNSFQPPSSAAIAGRPARFRVAASSVFPASSRHQTRWTSTPAHHLRTTSREKLLQHFRPSCLRRRYQLVPLRTERKRAVVAT